MTDDFIEDATDLLHADKELSHVLIAAHFGSPHVHMSANVPSRKHLEWMKRRFEDLCRSLERQYDEAGQ